MLKWQNLTLVPRVFLHNVNITQYKIPYHILCVSNFGPQTKWNFFYIARTNNYFSSMNYVSSHRIKLTTYKYKNENDSMKILPVAGVIGQVNKLNWFISIDRIADTSKVISPKIKKGRGKEELEWVEQSNRQSFWKGEHGEE